MKNFNEIKTSAVISAINGAVALGYVIDDSYDIEDNYGEALQFIIDNATLRVRLDGDVTINNNSTHITAKLPISGHYWSDGEHSYKDGYYTTLAQDDDGLLYDIFATPTK